MARPERKDVDYFPFYIKDGRTLFILESKYKCKGTGFFTNVLRFLSRTQDHHFQIEKKSDRLYFFATAKCDEESGMDMIKIMIETKKLDRDLWEQKRVLASQDYLDSIQDAYRKRTNECITINEIRRFYGITTGINEITPAETTPEDETGGISTGENPQTKVKKTIVKKEPAPAGHFSNKNKGYAEQIESEGKLIEKLKIDYKFGKINIWQLIQEVTNKNTHPKAIYESLRALRGGWDGITTSYQGYFRNILTNFNAKYNERDRIRACKAYKAELLEMPKSLLNLVNSMGV